MAFAGDTFASTRFSTAAVPARERLTAYRDMLGRSVGHFEVAAIGDGFRFSSESLALPGLGIAQIASSALRIERTRDMTADATRDLVFAVVHEGSSSRVQRGREVVVKGSGAFLSSSHDRVLTERTAARLTNYSLLSSDLAPAVSNLDRAMLAAIPVGSEAIRLLTGYTSLLFSNGAPAGPHSCRLVVNHIHDLIALALGATRDAVEVAKTRGLRAARCADLYARAGRLIALRFDEPDLASGEIAHGLGVSLRLLQKVFAERGETVMGRLWEERVNRAAQLLSAPEATDRSVTDIAFACGFNDSSHFGRVFAERMGTAPSRWRKQRRAQGLIAGSITPPRARPSHQARQENPSASEDHPASAALSRHS
jgi:AraC-like DNA-binding protein